MANLSPVKVKMPEQSPTVRNKNFYEVSLGYTPEMAIEEASRCLNCKNKPCVSGCPVNVKIPEFISLVAAVDFEADFLFGELDSLSVTIILFVLSKEYDIPLNAQDVTPKNFKSLDSLVKMVEAKLENTNA